MQSLNLAAISTKRLTGIVKICKSCNKDFYVPGWRLKKNPKYCSPKCYFINKHDSPWNKGTKGAIKPNKTSFKSSKLTFSGTIKEYKALHYLIAKLYGKPDICEICNKSKLYGRKIHWANKSGRYLLERNDWLRLCVSCHFKHDYYQHVGVIYNEKSN